MPHGQRFDESMSCGKICRAAEEKPGLFALKVRDPHRGPRETVLAGGRIVKGFIESRAAVLCEEDDDFRSDVSDLPLKAFNTVRVACKVFAWALHH